VTNGQQEGDTSRGRGARKVRAATAEMGAYQRERKRVFGKTHRGTLRWLAEKSLNHIQTQTKRGKKRGGRGN